MKISEKLKQWTLGAVLSVVVALPVSLFGDELSRVVGEAVKIGEWHALRAFDFYENFGNEGVKIDSENLTMMFLHRDPESRMHSYKSFRLDVVEPAVEELVTIDQKNYQQDAVEFHLVPEQRNELTNNLDSHITHENSRPKLNLDKAMEKFQDIVVPTKYKTDVKGGAHLSFSNVRITLYKKEDGTSEATQFEYFYITENPDGSLVFKIETLTPEEPIFIDRTKIWEEVIPSIPEIEDEENKEGTSDITTSQAYTNSLEGWYTYVQADKHYPWGSVFTDLMQGDLSLYIVRKDDVEERVCEITSDFSFRATFSWWIDRFWEEDFSVNIELENEIYYRAEEESNDELLDQSTALSEVRGGGLGATPPGGRGIFQRRTVDTDTQSKGEKNDIWGIVEVRLYGDFDGDWDNDVIGGVGRILPKRIDTDRPEGFNLKWTINERGEEADSHNYRIKLLSSVRTKGMF